MRSLFMDEDTAERARRAVTAMRREMPTLRSFARALTGDSRINVRLTSGSPSTDGKNINMSVPIRLGDKVEHNRKLCGYRDDVGVQRCEACELRETIFAIMFHETAHIIHNSFEEPDMGLVWSVIEEFFKSDVSGSRATKVRDRVQRFLESAPEGFEMNWMAIARQVSPYLPTLINLVEDQRVNAEVMEVRPGTINQFRALYADFFKNGIEMPDGSRVPYDQTPPNAQATMALYLITMKAQALFEFLSPEVAEVLKDDEILAERCAAILDCKSVQDAVRVTLPILERLRELGFFLDPEDPEDEPEPESEDEPEESDQDDQPDESDKSDEDDDDGQDDESEPEPESDDDEPEKPDDDNQSHESEDMGEPEPEGEADDEDDDEDGETNSDDDDSEKESGTDDEESESSEKSDEESFDDEESDDPSDNSEPEQDDVEAEDDDEGDGADTDEGDDDEDNQSGSDSDEGSEDDGDGESDESQQSEGDQPDDDGDPEEADDGEPSEGDKPQDGDDDSSDGDDGSEGDDGAYSEEDQERDGTPSEVERIVNVFAGHANDNLEPWEEEPETEEDKEQEEMIKVALNQAEHFDRPSANVSMVNEWRYDPDNLIGGWASMKDHGMDYGARDAIVDPRTVQACLQQGRRVFTQNRKGQLTRHLERGAMVDGKVLGRRIPTGDDRIFAKRTSPGRRSYFVLVGIDVSGSTVGTTVDLIKDAAAVQCEFLARMPSVNFALYAHSGSHHRNPSGYYGTSMDIHVIKTPDEPWGREQRESLDKIYSHAYNLDGHTMEFYRKVVQARRETSKLILYYTDGAMPAENHDEELEILQAEIRTCRGLGIHLVGVGVGTDSPNEHGLDTLRLDAPEDTPKVLRELQKRLV